MNIVGAAATVIVAVAIRDIPQWPADWMIIIDPTAHATGIALAAFVNYFGHRYITFSRAPPASVLDSKAPESADPSGLLNDHT